MTTTNRFLRLEDVASFMGGSTPLRSQPQFFGGGIPWVKTTDLNNSLITNTEETLTQLGLESSSCKLVPANAVLVAMYGGYNQIGRTGLLTKDCAINQALTAVLPDKSKLLPKFLLEWLNFRVGYWKRFAASSRKDPNITRSDVEDFPIPCISLEQQHGICRVLDAWSEALEKLDALIAAKERRKQGLMQQLLAGKLRFSTSKKSAWKKVRMGELLTRVFRPIEWAGDMQLSLVSLRRRCGGLFRRPDVLGADYKTQDLHELLADDFLVSKRQVAHGAWGLVPPDFAGSHVSKEYAIFVNVAPGKLYMPFFAWLAQTPRMIRLARVASTGVHIEKLIFDPDVFLRESIRIPTTVAEQKQIAAILDAAQTELNLLRAQRAALAQQKRGLMQRLLTGRVRVKTNH